MTSSIRVLALISFFITTTSLSFSQVEADTTLARTYLNKIDDLSKKEKYDEVERLLDKAETIYEKHAIWDMYTNVKVKKANMIWSVYRKKSVIDSLQPLLDFCIAKLGSNSLQEAEIYQILTTYWYYQRDVEKALTYNKKSEDIFRAKGTEASLIKVFNEYGRIYSIAGDHDSSKIFYLKALDIAERTKGKELVVAATLNNLGTTHYYSATYDSAIYYYRASLAVREEQGNGEDLNSAGVYYNLGNIYFIKGNYDRAITSYKKTIKIRSKALGASNVRLANTYANLGQVYLNKENVTLAEEYITKSLDIYIKQYGENSYRAAYAYANLGAVHTFKGNLDKALELNLKAYELTGDKSLTHTYISDILLQKGDYEKALQYMDDALEEVSDAYGYASCYRMKALIFTEMKQWDEAKINNLKSIEGFRASSGGKSPQVADAYNNIAKIHLINHEYDSALNYVSKSFKVNILNDASIDNWYTPRTYNYIHGPMLLTAMSIKAQSELELGRKKGSYQKVISTLEMLNPFSEEIKSSLQTDQDKVEFSEIMKGIHILQLELNNALYQKTSDEKHLANSFKYSEKSKSAVLRGALGTHQINDLFNLPDQLSSLEKDLSVNKAYYQNIIGDLKIQSEQYDTLEVQKNEKIVKSIDKRSDSLISYLKIHYPDYYDLKYSDRIISVKEVKSKLSKSNAVISYFLADTAIHIFSITKEGFKVYFKQNDADVAELISRFRKNLETGVSGSESRKNFEQYTQIAHQLFKELLEEPLSDFSNAIDELIIIPDGELGYLPFEILLTKRSDDNDANYRTLPYLLKNYSISYQYSATLAFDDIFQRSNKPLTNKYIAFAPSYDDYEVDSIQAVRLGQFRDEISSLKWNQPEVNSIGQKLEGASYTGTDADEQKFKNEVGNYGIVHLAMHALIDDVNPMDSKLVFTQNKDSLNDGFLHAYELYNMKIPAEMAVLSACETGYGKLAQGEGIMSLGRAFFYAGCKSIVMSHWLTNDESTAQLMDYFYDNLTEGQSKDEALTNAKLTYLENADNFKSHPYFWGQFVALGDMKPLSGTTGYFNWLYAVLCLAGFVLILYLIEKRF